MLPNSVHTQKISTLKGEAGIGKRKIYLLILSAFLVLFSITSFFILKSFLDSEKVYEGVEISGQNVSGMTRQELHEYLEERYSKALDDIPLTVFSDRYERDLTLSSLGVKIDISAMADKAFEQGRKGNVLERLAQIWNLKRNPVSIDLLFSFDSLEFESFLDEVSDAVRIAVTPPNIIITENSAVLCTGIPGKEADREILKAEIIKAIRKMEPAMVSIPVVERMPPSIDIEATLKTLNQEPVNASFVKTSRTSYDIKPHQMGRKLDRAELLEIVSYVDKRKSQEYEEIVLPVEFTKPAVTQDDLKAKLFSDTLASYTTYFNTDTETNKNRGINIGLAAQSIDGTILLPGEEFSFNNVVGPRTPEKGYKTAHIFVEGEIRDGTGGGICQVSTTLYNAVLRANLDVSERHNHTFTVGYVPLGFDAAVSYGYSDMKFQNNTDNPLMIRSYVSPDNSITFKILSANDHPGIKVELANKVIRTIPITTTYVENSFIPKGTVIVEDTGLEGYVVDTYMKVFNGGVLIKEEQLGRSIYQMIPKKIIQGTAVGN